ncbi:MAG: hypothetical protein WC205_14165 [Opitutaceae bacterium]|jgi:hypothetical protein
METYSAPADLNAFADGWTALLDELYVKRGYRCIKWINPINEPGYWWWHLPESYRLLHLEGDREASRKLQMHYLAEACAILRQRLRTQHPGVRLMGPDETDMPVYERLAAEPWFASVDDVDFHSYNSVFDHEPLTKPWHYHIGERLDPLVRRYSAETHASGKGFYLTEVGSMVYGYGADNRAPGSHLSSLKDAEVLIRSLAAGVDGFSHWSFTNRGDIDGQWQLIDTWSIEHKNWLPEARPHRPAFDLLGRAMRHVPKQAHIFPVEIGGGLIGEVREQSRQRRTLLREQFQRVWAVGVRDPESGGTKIIAVNNSEEPFDLTLELPESPTTADDGAGWSALSPWTDARDPLKKSLLRPRHLRGTIPPAQITILSNGVNEVTH